VSPLFTERCFNHAHREAAARCRGCGHFFCRECVSEHANRLLCAACLRKAAQSPARARRGQSWLLTLELVAGILILWISFYSLGLLLLRIPTEFHEEDILRAFEW
jgi:hypothetical protein